MEPEGSLPPGHKNAMSPYPGQVFTSERIMAYIPWLFDGYFLLSKIVTVSTKVSLFVWLIVFDLSGMGNSSDVYAIAGGEKFINNILWEPKSTTI